MELTKVKRFNTILYVGQKRISCYNLKTNYKTGVVVHNSSTQDTEAGGWPVRGSLGYIVSEASQNFIGRPH